MTKQIITIESDEEPGIFMRGNRVAEYFQMKCKLASLESFLRKCHEKNDIYVNIKELDERIGLKEEGNETV